MTAATNSSAGGFLPPTLPSPPSSSITSLSQTLPHPRAHPLKSGSAKESSFINYVDQGILNVTRRYAKKFSAGLDNTPGDGDDEAGRGYENFGEVARDLEALVDVVWVSGTPSLQIPYLLTLSLMLSTYFSSFGFAPRPTFHLLHKVDIAFASLLQGRDVETGETLPGFEGGGRRVSQTEKVRIKGVVERTRVGVVEVAGKGEESADGTTQDGMTEDSNVEDISVSVTEEEGDVEMDGGDGHGGWEMEVARVYERTIVELGDSLGVDGVGSVR
ncbi:MAG: hypothetical protein M1830_002088 [Pleopsidium flavum]|nr:MAG: hypothetical protein M1830_002088 [Pleopsidium flavum]